MLALNTPETEIMFELMFVANNKPAEVENLISKGWGVYPSVLNALIFSGYSATVYDILHKVSEFENYPVDEMKAWMEGYYEENWKTQVAEFGMQKIAAKFFTYEECMQAGFTQCLMSKTMNSAWANLAAAEGIESVEATYLRMCNELNTASPKRQWDAIHEVERFLCHAGEYEFLYNRQCWSGLSSSLEGVKYISEVRHYMNGLVSCVLGHHDEMQPEVLEYCVRVLDNAYLDEGHKPNYQEWRATYSSTH